MSATLEDWEFRIAKLELAPGDILVVKGAQQPNHDLLRSIVPGGVRILHIPLDVNLFVLTKAEIEKNAR